MNTELEIWLNFWHYISYVFWLLKEILFFIYMSVFYFVHYNISKKFSTILNTGTSLNSSELKKKVRCMAIWTIWWLICLQQLTTNVDLHIVWYFNISSWVFHSKILIQFNKSYRFVFQICSIFYFVFQV